MRILPLCLYLVFALVIVSACGPGPAEEPQAAPSPEPPPSDASAIRDVDFDRLPETQTLIAQIGGGRVDGGAIVFSDLTDDGRDEAVVPITSDGTLGNLAYLVFTMRSDQAVAILTRTGDRTTGSGLRMSIDGGKLVEAVGVYGNEDPLCCPSELRETRFGWDGSELQVEGETTVRQDGSTKF